MIMFANYADCYDEIMFIKLILSCILCLFAEREMFSRWWHSPEKENVLVALNVCPPKRRQNSDTIAPCPRNAGLNGRAWALATCSGHKAQSQSTRGNTWGKQCSENKQFVQHPHQTTQERDRPTEAKHNCQLHKLQCAKWQNKHNTQVKATHTVSSQMHEA